MYLSLNFKYLKSAIDREKVPQCHYIDNSTKNVTIVPHLPSLICILKTSDLILRLIHYSGIFRNILKERQRYLNGNYVKL